jgi:hypothetical protein
LWACPKAQHHGESEQKEEAANRLRLNELAREELEARGGNEGSAVDDVPQKRRCQPSEKVEEQGRLPTRRSTSRTTRLFIDAPNRAIHGTKKKTNPGGLTSK